VAPRASKWKKDRVNGRSKKIERKEYPEYAVAVRNN